MHVNNMILTVRLSLQFADCTYLEAGTNGRKLGLLWCFLRQLREKICNKWALRFSQESLMFCNNIIFIFVQEMISLIGNLLRQNSNLRKSYAQNLMNVCVHNRTYISSIMIYIEISSSKLRLAEAFVPFISLVHLLRKGFMSWFWKHAARERKKLAIYKCLCAAFLEHSITLLVVPFLFDMQGVFSFSLWLFK